MMVVVPALIAVLGIVFLLILWARLRVLTHAVRIKRHRSKAEGMADLLNYAAEVEGGVILGKNGTLMAAWIYQGDDNANATEEQRNSVSHRVNQALVGLGSGWMIHVDAIRRDVPHYSASDASHFPDRITLAIDEERRRYFEQLGTVYDNFFVLTVTYYPPLLAQAKFVELLFDDGAQALAGKARSQGIIDHFNLTCENIDSRLSSALKLQRLRGHRMETEDGTVITHDDFLRYLHFCISGMNHPVILPSTPVYLDALLGGQEMWGGVVPKIGRHFVQVVAIEGFPLESFPGMLSKLAELPLEYRWSTRFIFLDQREAIAHLETFRKKWRQKIRGFLDQVINTNHGPIDQDAVSMVQDAEDAMAAINSGVVAAGYYTSVVVLMHEDRAQLDAAARQAEKAINELGFVARVETVNTMDAFLGSLPGHGVENVRRPLINTMNLADLLPTSTLWTGNAQSPCPLYPPRSPALMHCVTPGRSPFRLNLHTRDVGHTIMFGPTGAGKSTHLGLLAAQLRRYRGMRLFAFDRGMSLYTLCKAVGGRHYAVADDDETLAFCPLRYLETKSDRAWAMEWIDILLALNGVNTTPAQRNEIGNAILNMHATGARTLTDFTSSIQSHEIREALEPYTVSNMMGYLLDAAQDNLLLSDFTVFEIEDLMMLGEKYALPVLLYLFRRIERSLTGQPAAILLDEAWLMLAHPAFREKIREWLKVLRKANCMVVMATQSLSDAAGSGILDVIVESTATKIFLPNLYARDEQAVDLYSRMGLNRRQIEILANAIPKRQYYYVSEQGSRLYELALGPLALAFVGVSDKSTVAVIKQLEVKYGEGWVDEWLERNHVRIADDAVEIGAAA